MSFFIKEQLKKKLPDSLKRGIVCLLFPIKYLFRLTKKIIKHLKRLVFRRLFIILKYKYFIKIQKKTYSGLKIHKKLKNFNVLFVGDEFTKLCLSPEWNLIQIKPGNWHNINPNQVDLFFCESAWRGIDNAWQNIVTNHNSSNNKEIIKVVDWCRSNKIPTLFWNKEDPPNFWVFIETALHFDYIFTTDAGSIKKYNSFRHENVFALPFAAQPYIHNEKNKYSRKNKVFFSGTYFNNKYPKRKKILNKMLEISQKYGLDIFDRNHHTNNPATNFPEKFHKNIIGFCPPEKIEKVYKSYKVALNVNSVENSPTMFSRRVFELLACGTPVISNYSEGIENLIGNDIVTNTNDINIIEMEINKLLNDESYYNQKALKGIECIKSHHLYEHRLKKMLKDINIHYLDE